jgi:predicted nuclease of predicted toxin-antitoxin system
MTALPMNPKLLADENVPIASVKALRQAGFDVLSASELEPGGADERVLERAVAANAILVTFDADFGGLIYQQGLQRPLGILYLRFSPAHPLEPAELLLGLLKTDLVLIGLMTVLERNGLRQRPL